MENSPEIYFRKRQKSEKFKVKNFEIRMEYFQSNLYNIGHDYNLYVKAQATLWLT